MKKLLALTLLLSLGLVTWMPFTGVAAVFPTAVATDGDLIVARNRARTTLNTSINSSITTVVLASGSLFGNNMVITIDSEDLFCTTLSTNTFTSCTRGYGGSTTASHTAGVAVLGNITANHHNVLKDEIKAIETLLSTNGTAIPGLAGLNKFSCTTAPDVLCQLYDDTASTGVSRFAIQAGANQGTNNLALFQDVAGNAMSGVGAGGQVFTVKSGVQKIALYQESLLLTSDSGVAYKSATDINGGGSFDLRLGRAAAGVLVVDDGAGNPRDAKLRNLQQTNNTEPTCDSSSRGTYNYTAGGAGVADILRVCIKDATDTYAWVPIL